MKTSKADGNPGRRGRRPQPANPIVLPALEEFIQPKSNEGYLDAWGREKPDPTPMAPPIGYKPSEPLHLRIRQMVENELRQRAEAQGFESPEEADDFDVDDDYDPTSPWEHNFDPPIDPPEAPQAPQASPGNASPSPTETPPNDEQSPAPSPSKPASKGQIGA